MRHPGLLLVGALSLAMSVAGRGWTQPGTPDVQLRIQQSGPGQPWVLSVRNAGSQPALLANSARLLTLEVSPGPDAAPVRCGLPKTMLPPPRAPWRLLAPGAELRRTFDPRLYCFSETERKSLAPGALVRPRLGWRASDERSTKARRKKRSRASADASASQPSLIVQVPREGTGGDEGDGGAPPVGVTELVGPPISLDQRYQAWSAPAQPAAGEPLALRMVAGSDTLSGRDATVTLAVVNRSQRIVPAFLRFDALKFQLKAGGATAACEAPEGARQPDRAAFVRLQPHERRKLQVRLYEVCPRASLKRAGLYEIGATLDTRSVGDPWGIGAFVGAVEATAPALVRVQRSTVRASRPGFWRSGEGVPLQPGPEGGAEGGHESGGVPTELPNPGLPLSSPPVESIE